MCTTVKQRGGEQAPISSERNKKRLTTWSRVAFLRPTTCRWCWTSLACASVEFQVQALLPPFLVYSDMLSSRGASSAAIKRLTIEYKQLSSDPTSLFPATGPIDESNYLLWEALVPGPEGTPFEGGVFSARLTFRESNRMLSLGWSKSALTKQSGSIDIPSRATYYEI